MDIFLEILQGTAVGMLGVIFYTVFMSLKFFLTWNPFKPLKIKRAREWDWRTLLGENFGAWVWSLIMVVSIVLIQKYSPETLSSLSSLGFDIGDSGSFIGIGFAISVMVKEAKDKLIVNSKI